MGKRSTSIVVVSGRKFVESVSSGCFDKSYTYLRADLAESDDFFVGEIWLLRQMAEVSGVEIGTERMEELMSKVAVLTIIFEYNLQDRSTFYDRSIDFLNLILHIFPFSTLHTMTFRLAFMLSFCTRRFPWLPFSFYCKSRDQGNVRKCPNSPSNVDNHINLFSTFFHCPLC